MRHGKKGRKLNINTAHRRALLSGLACELVKHGRIQTTIMKAKEVRPVVERAITIAKRGDVHSRRLLIARLRDKEAVEKLMATIVGDYEDRQGGYTRILKLGPRKGDGAEMAIIELV